jgi:hypothetical protein
VTPFGEILKRVVEETPGALGGAFADSQGEIVDSFAPTYDAHDFAIVTAHYGVILGHIHAILGIWHYGGPEYFVAQHTSMSLVVVSVTKHYYALLALADPMAVPDALATMHEAATALHREMM